MLYYPAAFFIEKRDVIGAWLLLSCGGRGVFCSAEPCCPTLGRRLRGCPDLLPQWGNRGG
jgi:hypothetical protein